MPTGYTAELMEKGMDFNSFILTCARAFGACIELRDDKLSPSPRKIKGSDSNSYHDKLLKESKRELKEFVSMSQSRKEDWAEKSRQDSIKDLEKWLEKDEAENKRLLDIEEKVNEWVPPTPEHIGLKEFMLQQIKVSLHDTSYQKKEMDDVKDKSLEELISSHIESLKWSVKYHSEGVEEQESRVTERNDWLESLYSSLNIEEN